MNGKDLLEAMGHVDEKYVDEAEYGKLRKPLSLGWLSVAACLCLLIGGAMFLLKPGYSNDCAAMPESNGGSNMAMDSNVAETAAGVDRYGEEATEAEYSYGEVPFTYLRIQEWTEDGFVGVVEETGQPDSYALESGTALTVLIDKDTTTVVYVGSNVYRWENRMPTEADFPVGTLVAVEVISGLEEGILWTPCVRAVKEGEE